MNKQPKISLITGGLTALIVFLSLGQVFAEQSNERGLTNVKLDASIYVDTKPDYIRRGLRGVKSTQENVNIIINTGFFASSQALKQSSIIRRGTRPNKLDSFYSAVDSITTRNISAMYRRGTRA